MLFLGFDRDDFKKILTDMVKDKNIVSVSNISIDGGHDAILTCRPGFLGYKISCRFNGIYSKVDRVITDRTEAVKALAELAIRNGLVKL